MHATTYCPSMDGEYVALTELEDRHDLKFQNGNNGSLVVKINYNGCDTKLPLFDNTKSDVKSKHSCKQRINCIRKLTSVSLSLAFFSLGLFLTMIGPSLITLQRNVSVSFQPITFVFTARSLGYLLGALIGGILHDRLNANLVLGFSLIGPGLTGYVIPWTHNYIILLVLMLINGTFLGSIDTAGNTLCVKFWGRKSAPFLQMMYFTAAVGGTVAPLLIGAFLNPSTATGTQTFMTTPRPLLTTPNEGLNTSITTLFPSNSSRDSVTTSLQFDKLSLSNELWTEFDKSTDALSKNNTSNNATANITEDLNVDHLNHYIKYSSSLWIPHFIIATFSILVSFPFFVLFILTSSDKYRQLLCEDSVTNDPRLRDDTESSLASKVQLLTLLSVFLFLYESHEVVLGGFIYTFALSSNIDFTPQTASFLNSAFWGSFALSRASAIYIATKISPTKILSVNLTGCLFAATLLLTLGSDHKIMLWLSTIGLGVAMAPIFPTSVSWIERRVTMTGKVTSSFIIAASGSEILLPWILGMLIKKFTLSVMVYVIFILSVAAMINFMIMHIRARKFIPKQVTRL